jgi:tRNA threonylcarbamoyladenosine biosynthesis protein TsaE
VRESGAAFLNVATPEQMQALGRAIGEAIDADNGPIVIALEGELGAGKTTLVSGILRVHGISGPVRSPTYTLIEPYEAQSHQGQDRQLYHLDLYRLVDPEEVEPLGIRDLLNASAVLLIEWPSRAAGALPAFDLEISIDYPPAAETGRQVGCLPHSPAGRRMLQRIVAAIPEFRPLST